jgi:hypothetical protein
MLLWQDKWKMVAGLIREINDALFLKLSYIYNAGI